MYREQHDLGFWPTVRVVIKLSTKKVICTRIDVSAAGRSRRRAGIGRASRREEGGIVILVHGDKI